MTGGVRGGRLRPVSPDPPPLLLHVFSTFAVGGPQVRTARLIDHFGPRYRHAVIALDGQTACRRRLSDGDAVTFLDPPSSRGPLPVRMRRIATALRRIAPDLLLTYNWGAIEWALVHGIAGRGMHYHFEEGFGIDEAVRQKRRRAAFRRLALARADRLIVPSRTLFDLAVRRWGISPQRLRLVPNGVDLSRFAGGRAVGRRSPPPRSAAVVVGTVAPLRPEKNIARLIAAVASLPPTPPVTLMIAGDGSERRALEAQARSLGLEDRVRFLGHVPRPETLYPHFDIFALSSDTEQLPTTVIEAMASGRPVAATDVGDVAAMVCDANRPFVVPPDRLGEAIGTLIAAGSVRRALIGTENRRKAEQDFDETRMLDTYRRLFDRAQGDPSFPHPRFVR